MKKQEPFYKLWRCWLWGEKRKCKVKMDEVGKDARSESNIGSLLGSAQYFTKFFKARATTSFSRRRSFTPAYPLGSTVHFFPRWINFPFPSFVAAFLACKADYPMRECHLNAYRSRLISNGFPSITSISVYTFDDR